MTAPFLDFAATCRTRVDHALAHYLPNADQPPTRLHTAMRYATLNGGKRVRPILVYASGQLFDLTDDTLDAIAAAIECIHSYSLIHDDLPAMDDDDLRRGQPTCHKQFDEATAILAGDALQTLAFQILSRPSPHISAAQQLAMLAGLADASGSNGMAGGQAIDLSATGQTLTLPELEKMHTYKTGALIRASVTLGAHCAPGLDASQHHTLEHYANCIGLAFQIHDDILDVESSTDVLGKTGQKDLHQNKVTYPSILGLAEAKNKRQQLHQEALDCLSGFGDKANYLQAMADFIIQRVN